jgi:hypothetical protein
VQPRCAGNRLVSTEHILATSAAMVQAKTLSLWERFLVVLKQLRRIAFYALILSPVAVGVAFGQAQVAIGVPTSSWLEECLWDYTIWGLETLGPTFIKFGQWASTRPDIFPDELMQRLVKLQDEVKPHGFADTEVALRLAYGEDWAQRVTVVQPPIGSGCIAQVYKGTAVKAGQASPEPVVIKVIHPGVREMVETDMSIMSVAAAWVERTFPSTKYLSLADTVAQFQHMMEAQLDLRVEAENLMRFSKNFEKDKGVTFPLPLEAYIRRDVLIESFVSGMTMMEAMESKDEVFLKVHAMNSRLQNWCVSLRFPRSFPHIRATPTTNRQPHLTPTLSCSASSSLPPSPLLLSSSPPPPLLLSSSLPLLLRSSAPPFLLSSSPSPSPSSSSPPPRFLCRRWPRSPAPACWR